MTIRIKPMGSVLLVVLCVVLLAACRGSTVPPDATATASGPQSFDWDRTPTATVFEMNRSLSGELHSYALNRLPLCILFGNGRLIWTSFAPATGQQVLETTLSEADTRAFLTFVISDQHFFSIPDYAAHQLTPSSSFSTDTMTINLSQGTYTTRSYGLWPNNEYQQLLDKCDHLASDSIPYKPTGGWMGVEPIEGPSNDPSINWGVNQPFQLAPLIHSQPIWISGDTLQGVWRTLRRAAGAVQWIENGERYRVFLQIPGLSPGAPPIPEITPTPFPTVTSSFQRNNPIATPTSASAAAPTSVATAQLAATAASTSAATSTR